MTPATLLSALAEAAAAGLASGPKRLPPWCFYDEEGSRLFEAITELPEYYPTRTERGILEASAAEMIEAAGPVKSLVELGAGTSTKTRLLIEALLAQRPEALYAPNDVSPSALALGCADLERRFPGLELRPLAMGYEEAFARLPELPGPRLVLFLGSSVGNFEPAEAAAFLARLRARLEPGDTLLLGTDLAKDPAVLLPAYDDAAGVTAAFNLNLLARLNRELGAGFELEAFAHRAVWNVTESRIEMHLESRRAQRVPLRALSLELDFAVGERIHTENSYKFTEAMAAQVLSGGGFEPLRQWRDAKDWFALRLARA